MAHSPADWIGAGCLGVSAVGVIGFGMAFVDADWADLDPRPVVSRAYRAAAFALLVLLLRFSALEGDNR